MEPARLFFLLQLGTTLPLVGLIWIVQLVSYPLFARVGAPEFGAYHAMHSRRITWIVAPLMTGELLGAALSVVFLEPALSGQRWLGLALAAATWGLTAFVSVPLHTRLAAGFDARAHRSLVMTNWLRTVAWTLRGVLLLGAMRGL